MALTEKEELSSIGISKEYKKIINEIVPKLPFFIPTKTGDFPYYPCTDYFSLNGKGIKKEIIDMLLAKNCFEKTSIIHLIKISLEKSHLKKIGLLPNLKRLIIEDRTGNLSEDLLLIKTFTTVHFLVEYWKSVAMWFPEFSESYI